MGGRSRTVSQTTSTPPSRECYQPDVPEHYKHTTLPNRERSTDLKSSLIYHTPPRLRSHAHRSLTCFTFPDSRSKIFPDHFFRDLPSQIYHCILQQLRRVHESPSSSSCHSCHLRDLSCLALTSRAWEKEAAQHLYGRIWLSVDPSKPQLKKLMMKMKQLRRTLRTGAVLSQYVRELHINHHPVPAENLFSGLTDAIASIVMTCPNLERLTGVHSIYKHEFDRLTHALSTRKRLKGHLWLIGENPAVSERTLRQLAPGLMDLDQKTLFLSYHDRWSSLTTLLLHSCGQGILERDIFCEPRHGNQLRRILGPGILHRLPSLKHLCVSGFDMYDFDDHSIQGLPPLHSLRLEDLEGVTFWGLSEFSRARSAFGLQSLALINIDVLYMSAISNLLLRLKNLKRFTLSQDSSPEIPPEEVVIQPVIASSRLEFIHWGILLPGSANRNLADSIRVAAFPRLRKIRAPYDHDGLLQALCQPRQRIQLPSDWSQEASEDNIVAGGLKAARLAAQQRLEQAWTTVQYKIIVEEDGIVNEVFDLSGFMGTIRSCIEYSLKPDVEGSDHALVDFDNVMAGGIAEHGNSSSNVSSPDASEQCGHEKRLWHDSVDLMKFF